MKLLSDDIDFAEYLKFSGEQESQFLIKPNEFVDEVISRFNDEPSLIGDKLPWNKTNKQIALRSSEVSIWAGINGHGKSELLGQVCAWNLHVPWLIASMEMKPSATLYRMTRQAAGVKTPSEWLIKRFISMANENLWIYDQSDSVQAMRILGMCYYAARELGVKHIIIDSLMKCGIPTDDYNAQKEFVDKLCWCAKNESIHIHLVHHIRKGDKENNVPDKFDIRGAGEITDLVDNVFIVHRNKAKEEKIEKGIEVDELSPDCVLRVAKQRHGEWEGQVALWRHQDSLQFVPSPDNRPMFYKIVDEERIAIQSEGETS